MPGLELVDIAIGLVFLYAVLSLISSAIGELIEAVVKHRAANLAHGLREMLSDPEGNELVSAIYQHPLIFSLFKGQYKTTGFGVRNLPSYIPSRNFAIALLDIVAPAGEGPVDMNALRTAVSNMPNQHVRSALQLLLQSAGNDIVKARENVSAWYDSTMDRVAGWYKRYAQMVTLTVGLLLAAMINADTIAIARDLESDRAMREALVAMASGYAERRQEVEGAQQDLNALLGELEQVRDSIGVPLGWERKGALPNSAFGAVLKLLGWFLTAVATSLGASFWFDLLKQFVSIRSTLKPGSGQQPG